MEKMSVSLKEKQKRQNHSSDENSEGEVTDGRMLKRPKLIEVNEEEKRRKLRSGIVNIMVIGPTGVGKSAACNLFCRVLKGPDNPSPFEESAGASACTDGPRGVVNNEYRVIDSPGLLDPKGIEADRTNILRIINHAREECYVNGIVIVMNWRCPRFDEGMQDAIKLYVDCFGTEMLTRMGFLFTHFVFSDANMRAVRARVDECAALLGVRCGCAVGPPPCWWVDCHPEELALDEVPAERVESVRAQTEQQVMDVLRWAAARVPLPTDGAVVGERAQDLRVREEAEKRVAEKTVVKTEKEYQRRVAGEKVTPIIESYEYTEKVGKKHFYKHRKVVVRKGTRVTGSRVDVEVVEEEREVLTYGSGVVTYGDWKVVKQWLEFKCNNAAAPAAPAFPCSIQ